MRYFYPNNLDPSYWNTRPSLNDTKKWSRKRWQLDTLADIPRILRAGWLSTNTFCTMPSFQNVPFSEGTTWLGAALKRWHHWHLDKCFTPSKIHMFNHFEPRNIGEFIVDLPTYFSFIGMYPQVPNAFSFWRVVVYMTSFPSISEVWSVAQIGIGRVAGDLKKCTSLILLPDVPGRKLGSMANEYSYNLLISGSILYWGYNPLILSFDPNFLGHPSSSFLPEICRSLLW